MGQTFIHNNQTYWDNLLFITIIFIWTTFHHFLLNDFLFSASALHITGRLITIKSTVSRTLFHS